MARTRKRSHEDAFSSQIMSSAIVASAWSSYGTESHFPHVAYTVSSPKCRIVPKPLSCKCKLSRCTSRAAQTLAFPNHTVLKPMSANVQVSKTILRVLSSGGVLLRLLRVRQLRQRRPPRRHPVALDERNKEDLLLRFRTRYARTACIRKSSDVRGSLLSSILFNFEGILATGRCSTIC